MYLHVKSLYDHEHLFLHNLHFKYGFSVTSLHTGPNHYNFFGILCYYIYIIPTHFVPLDMKGCNTFSFTGYITIMT